MSRDRLAEIEAREQAATPGPWESGLVGVWVEGGEYLIRLEGGASATVNLTPATRFFIAHARDDVPWLVAQVRERDAEIARLRALLTTTGDALANVGLRAARSWHAKDDGEIVLNEILTLESVAMVFGVAMRTPAERAGSEAPFVERVAAKCREVLDERRRQAESPDA